MLPSETVPEEIYKAGEELKIEESATCAAVLHVERTENDEMIFTVVPLVKREFSMGEGGKISVSPPERLQLSTERWPVSNDEDMLGNAVQETGPDKTATDKDPAAVPNSEPVKAVDQPAKTKGA